LDKMSVEIEGSCGGKINVMATYFSSRGLPARAP
jgi:hypothetical protein